MSPRSDRHGAREVRGARVAALALALVAVYAQPAAAAAGHAKGRPTAAPAAAASAGADTTRKSPAAPAAAASAGADTTQKSPAAGASAGADTPRKSPAADESLKGGQEGTVFKSLTIEGEDRVHVDFDRPDLTVDLDPQKAPGLTWGTARDVLDRTGPDLTAPLLMLSARTACPYLGRPWLSDFGSGAVARFTPDVNGVERWRLVVANSRGEAVTSFAGTGNPPRSIAWDGRAKDGKPVTPGLTYSYVFEAYDRAGNKRNFVGPGFTVSSYRLEGPSGPTLIFSGSELQSPGPRDPAAARSAGTTPLVVLEAASWLNQSDRLTQPLQISATARNADQANRLAQAVSRQLGPLMLGDPARVRALAVVQPDAPEAGTVMIAAGP